MDANERGTPHRFVFIDQDLPLLNSRDLINLASESFDLSKTFFVILFSLGNKIKSRHFTDRINISSLAKPLKYENFMACLGLAISKQLAQLMGGNIGVESTENKGSTFWFSLEFKKQAKVNKLPVPSTLKEALILIAAPKSTSRRVIIEYLKPFGCNWEEAEDGTTAFNKIMDAHW